MLWANETRLLFRAERTRGVYPSFSGTAARSVALAPAEDVRLDGVVLAAAEPASPYWILFATGAGTSIHFGRVMRQLEQLQAAGYNVLAFDYRGFGRSSGRPSESGLYDDALAAYRYLIDEEDVPASRIILAGRSLGSAVAVELATRVPAGGLLLLSPIESVPDTAALLYPWAPVRLLASHVFDSIGKAERIGVPAIVVHSPHDRLVPLASARRLFARLKPPKLMLETTGGHNRAGFMEFADLAEAMAGFWPPRIRLESTQSGTGPCPSHAEEASCGE
jgi:pimeloyl-ACP methyl ester carboxylesterase